LGGNTKRNETGMWKSSSDDTLNDTNASESTIIIPTPWIFRLDTSSESQIKLYEVKNQIQGLDVRVTSLEKSFERSLIHKDILVDPFTVVSKSQPLFQFRETSTSEA
jgi:hypothetical protein